MSQSYNAACAIARRPNQTDALAMKEAPNTITAFAIVFSIILDLDIFVLKYLCGFSDIQPTFFQYFETFSLIKSNLHFETLHPQRSDNAPLKLDYRAIFDAYKVTIYEFQSLAFRFRSFRFSQFKELHASNGMIFYNYKNYQVNPIPPPTTLPRRPNQPIPAAKRPVRPSSRRTDGASGSSSPRCG